MPDSDSLNTSTHPSPHESEHAALSGFDAAEVWLSWRALLIGWIAILQLLLVIYAPSLPTPFLYDDFANIVANEDLRADDPVKAIFSHHETSHQFDRRPVGGLLTLLAFNAGGLNEKVHRTVNVVVHWLCAGALAVMALQIGLRVKGFRHPRLFATLLASLWAFHPVQSTAVIYISQRMESLMTLFFLLSCVCLLKSAGAGSPALWRAFSVGAAFLCLLSKENGAVLPIALAVIDRLFIEGSWRRVVSHKIFYLALGAGWLCGGIWILGGPRVAEWDDVAALASPWRYFQTECVVVLDYLRMVFKPLPMVFAPVPRTVDRWEEWVPHCLALILVFGCIAKLACRKPWLWIPWLCFLGVLGPTSSFIPVPLEPAFDYRMHLPSAGVLSVALAAAFKLTSHFPTRGDLWGLGALAVVAALGVGTRSRAEAYARPETIWLDTAAREPENVKAWFNLSAVLMGAGRLDHSRMAAERARSVNEFFNLPWIEAQYNRMIGLIEEKGGKPAEAEGAYRKSVEIQPDSGPARVDLARMMMRDSRPDEALRVLSYTGIMGGLPVEGQLWKAIALHRLGRHVEARAAAQSVESARGLNATLEKLRDRMRREFAGMNIDEPSKER